MGLGNVFNPSSCLGSVPADFSIKYQSNSPPYADPQRRGRRKPVLDPVAVLLLLDLSGVHLLAYKKPEGKVAASRVSASQHAVTAVPRKRPVVEHERQLGEASGETESQTAAISAMG